MRTLKVLFASAILGLTVFTIPAMAIPISVNQSQNITANGQNFVFNFPGLDASDGNGGTFRFLARGDYTAPPETATVTFDSLGGSVVLSNCAANIGVPGLSLITSSCFTPLNSGSDTKLDFLFAMSGTLLDSLLADSNITVHVNNNPAVSDLTPTTWTDFIQVEIDYESAAAVPEPGTLLLLSSGLLGLPGSRWHQRRGEGPHIA